MLVDNDLRLDRWRVLSFAFVDLHRWRQLGWSCQDTQKVGFWLEEDNQLPPKPWMSSTGGPDSPQRWYLML